MVHHKAVEALQALLQMAPHRTSPADLVLLPFIDVGESPGSANDILVAARSLYERIAPQQPIMVSDEEHLAVLKRIIDREGAEGATLVGAVFAGMILRDLVVWDDRPLDRHKNLLSQVAAENGIQLSRASAEQIDELAALVRKLPTLLEPDRTAMLHELAKVREIRARAEG